MSDLESRLVYLEQLLAGRIGFDIQNLKLQLAALQNAQRQGSYYGGGGGGGDSVYVCYPAAAVSGATWTSGVPTSATSFSATVYQVSGTSTVTSLGTQTCTNWLPASLQASKACLLARDGAGNYVATGQSCT